MDRDVKQSDRNETRLIDAVFEGDAEQYHALIRPYESRVFKLALALVQNESDAEEVAQQVFLSAFNRFSDVRGQANFGVWLITITLDEARSRLGHSGALCNESPKEAVYEGIQPLPTLLQDWCEIPSSAIEQPEIRAMLQQSIAGLCHGDREVLLLRDMGLFSIEEAAAALRISVATVSDRLHRARTLMQRELAPRLRTSSGLQAVEQPSPGLIGAES